VSGAVCFAIRKDLRKHYERARVANNHELMAGFDAMLAVSGAYVDQRFEDGGTPTVRRDSPEITAERIIEPMTVIEAAELLKRAPRSVCALAQRGRKLLEHSVSPRHNLRGRSHLPMGASQAMRGPSPLGHDRLA
jgi:hypothetical protein